MNQNISFLFIYSSNFSSRKRIHPHKSFFIITEWISKSHLRLSSLVDGLVETCPYSVAFLLLLRLLPAFQAQTLLKWLNFGVPLTARLISKREIWKSSKARSLVTVIVLTRAFGAFAPINTLLELFSLVYAKSNG